METFNLIQRRREAEFNNLLNSTDSDIPLLFFPLRIETHFRKSRNKYQNDWYKILFALENLLDEFVEHRLDKDYDFIPSMVKLNKIIIKFNNYEESYYVESNSQNCGLSILSLAYIGSFIFYEFVQLDKKYIAYAQDFRKALYIIANDREEVQFPDIAIYSPAYNYPTLEERVQYIKEAVFSKSESRARQAGYHNKPKELCVRIFPDEIFLDYLTDNLTREEIDDAKFFWLQWFIASGSKKREYEAWQALCVKYSTYRAAWIVRQLKPKNINDFKKGDGLKKKGKLFYRRPFGAMAEIEDACDDIYRNLSHIRFDERKPKNAETGELKFEEAIRTYLGVIKSNLYQIDRDVMSCEYVVDYLFDRIEDTVQYLIRRLNTYIKFYERYPNVYGGNNRQMEIWDVDQTMLFTFRKDAEDFLKKLQGKRISLEDMIQKYLDVRMHNEGFFPHVPVNDSGKPDMPVSNILPDRFMFIGEVKDTKERIIHYGHKVRQNLQMGISPNEDMDEMPYRINENGDLEVSGGIDWMVDYDTAEEAGMAITVPLGNNIKAFNFVYVLGIKDTGGMENEYLQNLFNSHNYTSAGLVMLKPGTPTNIVEGGKPVYDADPEAEMRRRYEIEVEELYDSDEKVKYDSWRVSDTLNLNYNDCWGRTLNFDNKELSNTEKANAALWEYFTKKLLGYKEPQPDGKEKPSDGESADKGEDLLKNDGELEDLLGFTHDFVTNHVKARGALPLFRINNQPYGILPVTLFQKLNYNIIPLMKRVDNWLLKLRDGIGSSVPGFMIDVARVKKLKDAADTIRNNIGNIDISLVTRLKALFDDCGFYVESGRSEHSKELESICNEIKSKETSLIARLNRLLVELADKWKDIRKEKVVSFESLKGSGAEKKYLEMAGLTPHSVTFYERSLMDSPLLPERDTAIPSFFTPLNVYGYFDSLPVEGSEKEVDFSEPSSGTLPTTSPTPSWVLVNSISPGTRITVQYTDKNVALYGQLIEGTFISFKDSTLIIQIRLSNNRRRRKSCSISDITASVGGKNVIFGNVIPDNENTSPGTVTVSDQNRDFSLFTLASIVKDALPPEATDEECALLVSEFMDIFTYRLDAWFTGILDYLLRVRGKKFRYGSPAPRIGAYGWVFDLEENIRTEITGSQRTGVINTMKLTSRDSSDDLRIYQNKHDDRGEYIVAPSIQHAISAAVLRGSYLKTKKDGGDSHLCINLSSMRTRQALRMVEGIKQGMSTGIILGADLERYLHEAYRTGNEMDQYIYPLRKLFPQTVDLQAQDDRANNYAMEVINGEALLNTFLEAWDNREPLAGWLERNIGRQNWFGLFAKETNITESHKKCLFKLIERMADSYDALNDLLLAEGVHRLVMGDRTTYSAICNFMAEGKGNLPEPAILDTPMDHVVVSNQVGIAFPECKTPPNCPMGIAEPSANLWLEGLTGPLDNIIFYVETTDAGGKTCFDTCSLEELDIIPLEYLYLSSNENIFHTYIEIRWRLKNDCFTGNVKIHAGKPEECAEDIIYLDDEGEEITDLFTLYEDGLRISRLRSIVTQSGVMKANDWVTSAYNDIDEETTVDIAELKSRYVSLRTLLAQLSIEMQSYLTALKESDACDDDTLAGMYGLLCNCVESGMINSLPAFNSNMFIYGIDPETGEKEYRINPITEALAFDGALKMQRSFIEAFTLAQQQLDARILEAEGIVRMTSKEKYTSYQYIEAIQKLLLNNFKVCPRFTLHHALPKERRKAYDEVLRRGISGYDNLDETAFEEWQSDIAEVRELMKPWHHVTMFQEISNGDVGKVAILQTTGKGDTVHGKWLGCKVEHESELQDVDSFVIYNSEALAGLQTYRDEPSYNAGIVIDGWTEFIPYKKQTAGMVFHCDQPDNEAPQTLLLAVHPEFNINTTGNKWNLDNVLELLDSTKFMFMNRAVEPDHIYRHNELSTLLPLLSTILLSRFPVHGRSSGYTRAIWDEIIAGDILHLIPGGLLLFGITESNENK